MRAWRPEGAVKPLEHRGLLVVMRKYKKVIHRGILVTIEALIGTVE